MQNYRVNILDSTLFMDSKKCLSITSIRFFWSFLLSTKLNNLLSFSIVTSHFLLNLLQLYCLVYSYSKQPYPKFNFTQFKSLPLSPSVSARYKVSMSLGRSCFIPNPSVNCKWIFKLEICLRIEFEPLFFLFRWLKSRKKSEMPHFINLNAYNGSIVINATTFCLQDGSRSLDYMQ